MICRNCGAQVDTRIKRRDGSVQCANCRKVYYPRNSSPQPVKPQARRNTGKKTGLAKIPWKRRFAKLPLWLWCVIALFLLIVVIPGSEAPENSDAVVQPPVAIPLETGMVAAPEEQAAVAAETTAQPSPAQEVAQPALFPQTIFNSNGVKITLTGFEARGLLGPEIKVTVENSSGMNLYLVLGELYCDGWQLADFTALFEIADGAKAADTIYIYSTTLEDSGLKLEDLKEVSFKNAYINNPDNYTQNYDFEMKATLQR